jgi:HAD superfamily hydrolase (TIGR01490 family)
MSKKLALFDFDGTMTSKDTMLEFIRFAKGKNSLNFSYILLSPILLLMRMGLYPREKAKERLLSYHFKGWSREDLEEQASTFCKDILPNLLRDKALHQLQDHRMKGHDVFIVTASLDLWLKPWFDFHKIPYASSQGEFVDGVFTGKLSAPNLNGREKVKAVKNRFNLEEYETIFAYGDTPGDKPMLALAHVPRYKPFRGEIPIPGLDMR